MKEWSVSKWTLCGSLFLGITFDKVVLKDFNNSTIQILVASLSNNISQKDPVRFNPIC